jgi:hypothetical protein
VIENQTCERIASVFATALLTKTMEHAVSLGMEIASTGAANNNEHEITDSTTDIPGSSQV